MLRFLKYVVYLLILSGYALGLSGCGQAPPLPPEAYHGKPIIRNTPEKPVKPRIVRRDVLRPDPNLTPGATYEVTTDEVCAEGYVEGVRKVPNQIRQEVLADYGISDQESGNYEVDHLISLSLGGSNAKSNLWAQPIYASIWNVQAKRRLEKRLLELVCDGRMRLSEAQDAIATDWIAAYQKYVRARVADNDDGYPPKTSQRRNPDEDIAKVTVRTNDEVWANTITRNYWRRGTRWYGKTERGEYMSEREAKLRGYRDGTKLE